MKQTDIYRFSLLLILPFSLILYNCSKPKFFPSEPVIEFKDVKLISKDSMRVSFSFTDGDGDIGLSSEDVAAPFNPGAKYYNNVFIRYYEKVNGNWVQLLTIPYRAAKLTPAGKNKALKGKIIIYVTPLYYNYFSPDNDTIKYDIQLVDRSLHESNIIETGELHPHF